MPEQSSLQSELNEAQYEAVTYCDGPSLVIAGAGSGKTRVLTYKIAYLLQMGMQPWNILALTFTNKAAREMNDRIAHICGQEEAVRQIWSGTFHSIFARILRVEYKHTGYPQDFTIYDAADTKSLVKSIVKELQLDDKEYKPNAVCAKISEAKNHLIVASAYANEPTLLERDKAQNLGMVHKIYRIYQQRLRAAGAMDFDDLLLNTFLLLRDNQDVREHYMKRFQYVLVDEYQDTNMAQHRILSLLTRPDSRICVVGDDAQSIYGFRGADIRNILQFEKQYPSARVIKLECNYRSTQNIVNAANCIISHNRNQIPKKVYAAGEPGDKLQLFSADTDKGEAQKVVSRIVRLHRKGVDYNEIAILYRTNAQSRSFEEVLQGASVPYRIYGGLSFYQRKEIKDVMAYLRLTCNPHDEEAFRRIVNYPARGIGATTLGKLQMTAANDGVSMWEVAQNPTAHGLNFNAGIVKKLDAFCGLINSFRERLEHVSAFELASHIVKFSGIVADISADRSAESISRQENVEEFLGSISSYEREMAEQGRHRVLLSDFLPTVSLLTDADQKSDNTPRVTLMTVHASKGLEFDAVFVTGMEEDLFPNSNARMNLHEMEEERRLFYVAVTRAKRYCFLSYSKSRFRFGTMDFCEASPFLDEIDDEYLETEMESYGKQGFHSRMQGSGSSSYRATSSNPFSRGTRQSWDEDYYDDGVDSPYGMNSDSGRGRTWRSNNPTDSMRDDELADSSRGGYRSRYDAPVYAPKRVAPPVPPSGMKRVSVRKKVQGASAPVSSASLSASKALPAGTRIEHERFGKGTVVNIEGNGDSMKIEVKFDSVGVKKLLVKFAKFKLI